LGIFLRKIDTDVISRENGVYESIIMVDAETILKTILQRQVKFVVGAKVLKEGRIIVFNIKDYYISFIIDTKKHQNKTYEIPLPYKITTSEDRILFHYSNDLVSRNIRCYSLISDISKQIGKKSKLFDNMLIIECE
jgi:hypothetical protein